ncbi:hypothetical protein R6Q57_001436, partial [Mikania cordata]
MWAMWVAPSDMAETSASEMGVSGGKGACPGCGDSLRLEACKDVMVLWLVEGMEKLLETTNGGIGRGDATVDVKIGLLFGGCEE